MVIPTSSSADDHDDFTLIEGIGPTFITLKCDTESCYGFSLDISESNDSVFFDGFSWSGNLTQGLGYKITKAPGATGSATVSILTSDPDFVYEKDDVDGYIGHGSEFNTMPVRESCIDRRCEKEQIPIGKMTGWLSHGGDSDSWKIAHNGSAWIKNILSEAPMLVEIWHENEMGEMWKSEDKHSTYNGVFHEIGSLTAVAGENESSWVKIISIEQDRRDSVYLAEIFTSDATQDAPADNTHNAVRSPASSQDFVIRGISHSHEDVDSILVPAGGRVSYSIIPNITSEENYSVSVHEHLVGGTITTDLGNLSGMTSSLAMSLEIKFKLSGLGLWSARVVLDSLSTDFDGLKVSDGLSFNGDAPDRLPYSGENGSHWPNVVLASDGVDYNPNIFRLQGDVFEEDKIDVFLISVANDNGTLIRGESEYHGAKIQIQRLSENSFSIMNSTNGSQLFLPKGLHAIRVEQSSDYGGHYSFLMSLNEPVDEGPPIYLDLSSKATPYYLFAGFFLLAPSLLVIVMIRGEIASRILGRDKGRAIDQATLDEIRKELARRGATADLGEALSNFTSKGLISSRTRFIIEQDIQNLSNANLTLTNPLCEVGVWLDDSEGGIVSFGMHATADWKLACLRLSFPNGPRSEVEVLRDDLVHHEDEIMLSDIKEGDSIFFQIRLTPSPKSFEIEVSGRVKGENVAVVPRKSIVWE